MASELRVNSSTNRSGLGTITYTDSGPIVSGVGTFANGLTVDGTQTTVKSLKLTGDSYNANWFKTSNKLRFNDSAKATFGTADDLSIYHDGSHSYISEVGTGHLYFGASGYRFNNAAQTESIIQANQDGAVELYFNGAKKIETTNTGATITGKLTSDGLVLGDAETIAFGNTSNGDFKIYHDGSNASIQNITGNLNVFGGTNGIYLKAKNDENSIVCSPNAQVELYHDGSKKLETTSSGATVTGAVVADDLIVTGTSVVGDLKSTNNNYVLGLAGNNSSDKAYLGTDSSGNFLLATGSGVVERLCITSGGQVQIKETAGTSADGASLKFHFANNNSTDVISSIYFANNSGNVASIKGETRNGNNYGMIRFNNQVNGVDGESMRLNHDGGFCVGTDSTRTAEFTTPDGFSVRSRDSAKGQFQVSVTNETCALLNKKGNNGQIIGFRKDGTGVGEIGVNASTMYLNFGGTVAAAHQLDDYEEGSFTPTSNASISDLGGRYTKIGRQVTVHIRCTIGSNSSSNQMNIAGLPYAAAMDSSLSNGSVPSGFGYIGGSVINGGIQIHMNYNAAQTHFYNFGTAMTQASFSGRHIRFGIVYYAT